MAQGFTTRILHSDRQSPIEHGAVHKPMHVAVAFGYQDTQTLVDVFQGRNPGYSYGRQGNPTTAALEAKLNGMEDGIGTVTFATGMAAIAAIMTSLLKAGDHIVSSAFLFGNTNSLFDTLHNLGVEIDFVDATDAAAVERALRPETRMVFVETIANPRTQVAALAEIGELCRQRGVLYVVDNTMTSPYLFRPKTVGAGLSVNSLTKYICGHGNALGGAVTDTGLFDWTAYPNIFPAYRSIKPAMQGLQQIKKKALRDMGATLTSEAAHRIAAGAETLSLRMDRACANAAALAAQLAAHPKVKRVYHPSLPDHPQHARARELFRHGGALLSFELQDGLDPVRYQDALQVVISSTHLGDNRTLAIPVAQTIYWEMGAERRRSMDIADSLIRVSVGIEDTDDLLGDFDQAFGAV
ncbi:cystathionine gamma-synthase family protein [Pigmentiphaga soli]|uniref:Cystathionine gamma-synthase family protein n=1 Tax=Pigmentiphaga soli TaxID=1007095 RepID=A0ABP8GH09_9BURK